MNQTNLMEFEKEVLQEQHALIERSVIKKLNDALDKALNETFNK